MPNEFARNIQDASLNPAALTLPAAASTTVNGAAIDLGTDTFKSSEFEVELSVPALSATIAPDTRTFTVSFELSTAANFATVARTVYSKVMTGAGGVGIAASIHRLRIPSDSERYGRWKVVSGASTTDASALSARGSLRF